VTHGLRPRALVTGAGGQLGRALVAAAPAAWQVVPCRRAELDVSDADAVGDAFRRERPALVINAAAFTGVDQAETTPDPAWAVNARGAGRVARAAALVGARLIHLSTDFVFDGAQGHPYLPQDHPNPLGVYGRTKLEGEREVERELDGRALVLRTAWLYAAEGRNFVHTMLRAMRERDVVGVVADPTGSPTWARSLAAAIWRLAERPELRGVHHWTDAGTASWYDFAVAIQEEALVLGLLDRAVPVLPLRTGEFPAAARRPPFSVLDKTATWSALGGPPPHWRVNLRRMLGELARG
jgi:dTDP-4-dehydrorhamnose reductase